MNRLSVVIPSKSLPNLLPCIAAVRQHEPSLPIYVIDDGLPDRSVVEAIMIDGPKPFIFARNMNLGIVAAGEDDVVLLNDDALLESPGGLTLMQKFANEHPDVGLVSASTNVAGNPEQFRKSHDPNRPIPYQQRILMRATPGNSFPTVAFIAVMIPRRTIEVVGLLDERFGGTTAAGRPIYGHEDNDYCRRVSILGLKIAVHDGCYVDHSKLKSTFRGSPTGPGDCDASREIYLNKWKTM